MWGISQDGRVELGSEEWWNDDDPVDSTGNGRSEAVSDELGDGELSRQEGGRSLLKRAIEQYPPPMPLKRHASEAVDDEHASFEGDAAPQAVPLWRTTSNSSWSDDSAPSQRPSQWQGGVGATDRADIRQWRECSRIGNNVPGTPIVPCKTPFEGPLANRAWEAGLMADEDWFGKDDLLRLCAEQGTPIGLVVDLVNTRKYYAGFSEEMDGVEYQKIQIPGRTVPERSVIEEVFDLIDAFVARRPGEYVAMHCTHGINRTGFLVSAYLMTRAHLKQRSRAVAAFEKARGSKMDKEYLLEALRELEEGTY